MTGPRNARPARPGAGFSQGLLDQRVGPFCRQIRNILTARVARLYAPHDMPSGSFSALALINANPGCSQTDLAREIGLDKSAIAALMEALETRGYALRTRSIADRRRHVLTLSEAGARKLAEMRISAAEVERPINDELSAAEIAQLIGLLERVRSALLRDEAVSGQSPA